MKKNVFLLLIILIISHECIYCQDGYIKTPKGLDIEYRIELACDTLGGRPYADSLINENNWDATYIAPASGAYNCHSYAWNMSEGGPTYWINGWDHTTIYDNPSSPPSNTPSNIVNYWDGGGYDQISLAQTSPGDKVFYGSYWVWYGGKWLNKIDHSAIISSNQGYYISKWGQLPVYEHLPTDCPYFIEGKDYRAFYTLDNPFIYGSVSKLCEDDQRKFSETTFSYIDLDYDWDYSGYTLDYVSGGGTDDSTIMVKGRSNSDSAFISLSVTTPSGIISSALKEFPVNPPFYEEVEFLVTDGFFNEIEPYGGYPGLWLLCPNTVYEIHLEYENTTGCYLSNWDYNLPAGFTTLYEYGDMIRFNTNTSSGGYTTLDATTCCQDREILSGYLLVTYCGGYYMSFSPNPATLETTLSLDNESQELDPDAEWEIDIYDRSMNLKASKQNLKVSHYTLNVSSWKEGIYLVRLKIKDKIVYGKLVVSH